MSRSRYSGPHYDPILTELVPPRVELPTQWLAESDPRDMPHCAVAYTRDEAVLAWRTGYEQALVADAMSGPWLRDSLPYLLVFFASLALIAAAMQAIGLFGQVMCG